MSTVPAELSDLALESSPWPTVRADGTVTETPVWPLPESCRSCPSRPCRHHAHTAPAADVCIRNVNIVQLRTTNQPICIPGAITTEHWRMLPRKRKKALSGYVLTLEDVQSWVDRIDDIVTQYHKTVDAGVSDTLGMFHDVHTTFAALIRHTEAWISEQPGSTQDQQLEALTPSELNIVKTVQLLRARIALMPLVANPEAAKFGTKRRVPIYRACHRILYILSPLAAKKNIRLCLTGQSYNEPDCFDSFDTIPLVLIDNAIKYSLPGQSVDITINDGPGFGQVTVAVSSLSPTISGPERRRIFEKGQRGRSAAQLTPSGVGLGLYLGETVAEAHDTTIQHHAEDREFAKDRIDYSYNTFQVVVG